MNAWVSTPDPAQLCIAFASRVCVQVVVSQREIPIMKHLQKHLVIPIMAILAFTLFAVGAYIDIGPATQITAPASTLAAINVATPTSTSVTTPTAAPADLQVLTANATPKTTATDAYSVCSLANEGNDVNKMINEKTDVCATNREEVDYMMTPAVQRDTGPTTAKVNQANSALFTGAIYALDSGRAAFAMPTAKTGNYYAHTTLMSPRPENVRAWACPANLTLVS